MISLILASRDDARFRTAVQHFRQAIPKEPFEVVRIGDAASLAEAYNRALALSHGEILIFSHDDVEPLTADLASPIQRHLATYDIIGVAGTTRLVAPRWFDAGPIHTHGVVAHPYENNSFVVSIYGIRARAVPNIQALDGLFLACRRDAVEKVRWDAQTFPGFHLYDIDFTFRAHQMGLNLAVVVDIPLLHMSHGRFDASWQPHADAFLKKHPNLPPRGPYLECQWSGIRTATKEQVRYIMNELIESLP
jgi:hypothetical protein